MTFKANLEQQWKRYCLILFATRFWRMLLADPDD
jgi:hypothetical protein